MIKLFVFLSLFIASLASANEQFDKMPPAEHLMRAKRVISQLDARAARLHLQAIPPSAPEYVEAKKLLATMPALEKKQVDAARKKVISDRKQAQADLKTGVQIRKLFAKSYERQLLDKGLDAYASAVGKNCTSLKVKWILVNRPLVHQLCNNATFIQSLRDMGFKKLLMVDGYQYSWTIDL
ncbi:MAG: hypothetical protein HY888_08490 [Deltaproteobacteria bacterium]|nr:hypothetical protein [Deltaproteobacteria bacterium]